MEGLEETLAKLAEKLRAVQDDGTDWERLPLAKQLQALALAGFDVTLDVSKLPRPNRSGRLSVKDV